MKTKRGEAFGFAMARLPRPLWKKVMPDLTGSAYYPAMSWLAVDGYGFDRAYFDTRRWVDEQRAPAPYAWEGSPDYFLRAVDQGIGRTRCRERVIHHGEFSVIQVTPRCQEIRHDLSC